MIFPEPHIKEAQRLKSLEKYGILDSNYEDSYDNITALAAEISETPIALISLIDDRRQWFKSHHGLTLRETSKDLALCAHTINGAGGIMIVSDARTDKRFDDNPLVTSDPHVIFYAGVPLFSDDDLPLGTLCIIDTKPRKINKKNIKALKALAKQVMYLFEQRKLGLELAQSSFKLHEKNKKLEKFAFEVAHDIKSPLNNISAVSNLLLKQYNGILDQEGDALIELIKKSSDKLKVLIDDILNYYIDENKMREVSSLINISNFYDELFELFETETSLRLKLHTSLQRITVRSAVLYQIMVNLISNAIRYNDKENIEVTIGVSENPFFYEFYVKDNGPGIPEHLHNRIFELFKIGEHADKYGEKGKGIGLATAKKLIENLGGSITVENGKGSGCTFTFQIKKSTSMQLK